MEAFSLSSSISVASPHRAGADYQRSPSFIYRSISTRLQVYSMQSGNHAIKSTPPSSARISPTVGSSSLVLSPNGKELSTSTSVVEINGEGRGEGEAEAVRDQEGEKGIGIVQFLKGKTFLITGATGFLGKVLVEKILRTAPDVHKIFVLIKAKNKEAAAERLKTDIIHAELFKRLRQIHGKSYQAFMLSKLVPVLGNVCEANLGLDEDVAGLVSREVDAIINSAANTTFDERYDYALDINTGGPARLMRFAKQCQKLKVFLQISTAYVNGQRQGRIMEKPFCIGQCIASENGHHIPLPKLCVEDEIQIVLEMTKAHREDGKDDDDASVIQNMKELGMQRARKFGWQDTYVFTKAMGEMMIDSLRGDIPVVVIRPSVIESTYKEPFPGWMEGNRMMDPIILHYGKGQLTGFLVDPNGVLDVVPADMVVNATLAAMAKHGGAAAVEEEAGEGEEYSGRGSSSIYQVASSVVNPLVFGELARVLHQHFERWPFTEAGTGRAIRVPKMKLFGSMEEFSAHLWREAIQRTGLGALANLEGKLSHKLEAVCRKSVEQAKYLASIYESYTFYGGRFDNSNTSGLMGSMSAEERAEFGFDVESIEWSEYISEVHIPGLRRHVIKAKQARSSPSTA
ncbi:fatty acyl-CoA reductase 2, chloroplastic-like [Andrographis paniculata]|uniref:fatty acyl-CoA reductase 2, chloroplastic-like n=1 Tax=Andrographis paniculata TaxID=175694 RepID=UPI0021E8ECEF|nr:fatty acyl-CoA reductase 2, chloroplastic-like [Andrographis paniculata]